MKNISDINKSGANEYKNLSRGHPEMWWKVGESRQNARKQVSEL